MSRVTRWRFLGQSTQQVPGRLQTCLFSAMDSIPSTPSAKRVRWDDSVPPDPPQANEEGHSNAPAAPSCNANDAIKLASGERTQWPCSSSRSIHSHKHTHSNSIARRSRGFTRRVLLSIPIVLKHTLFVEHAALLSSALLYLLLQGIRTVLFLSKF